MKNAVTKNKEQINRLNTDAKFLINERRSDKQHSECNIDAEKEEEKKMKMAKQHSYKITGTAFIREGTW